MLISGVLISIFILTFILILPSILVKFLTLPSILVLALPQQRDAINQLDRKSVTTGSIGSYFSFNSLFLAYVYFKTNALGIIWFNRSYEMNSSNYKVGSEKCPSILGTSLNGLPRVIEVLGELQWWLSVFL